MQSFQTLPSVTITRETNVPASAIWQVLSDLPALADWAPGIDGAAVTSDLTTGVGAVREVTTAQFGKIIHNVTVWEENAELAYTTADSGPFSRTLTTYAISEGSDGANEISVQLVFEVKPGAITPEQAKAVLDKGLTATLAALEMRAKMAMAA